MRLSLALAVVLLVTGCTAEAPTPRAQPTQVATTTPTKSKAAGPTFDTWVVGAKPLPLRADGYGVIRRTPKQLRVRLLPTVDVLPPPTDKRYHATIRPVTRGFIRRTDLAWEPGCPVRPRDLSHLTLSYWGFDKRRHTGELVVNGRVAHDVVTVFGKLYAARFPMEQVGLITRKDLGAPPTGDGNGTGAYVCRPTRGTTTWSAHALGLAIDINPFNNPYTKGDCPPRFPRDLRCVLIPERALSYLDRSWRRPGMIYPGDVVTRAFASVGWTWGGDFRSLKDRHHFSANGR